MKLDEIRDELADCYSNEIIKKYGLHKNNPHPRWDFICGFDAAMERVKPLVEALDGILIDVSLDWYVQHFSKDTTSTEKTSGIAARIHNAELLSRIARRFIEGKEALAKFRGEE
jgi:hypothetical protein